MLIAREIGFHVEVDRSPILSLRQDAGPTKPEAWVAINPWQQRSKFGGDARARFVLQNSRRKHILQENPCIGQAAGGPNGDTAVSRSALAPQIPTFRRSIGIDNEWRDQLALRALMQ